MEPELEKGAFSTCSDDSEKISSDLETELYAAYHYNDFSSGIPENVKNKYSVSFNEDREVVISLKPDIHNEEPKIENPTNSEVFSISSDSESIIIMNKRTKYDDEDGDSVVVIPVKEPETVSITSDSDIDIMLNTSAPARLTTTDLEVSDIIDTKFDWLKVSSPKTWTLKMREYYNKPNQELRYFDHIKIRNDVKNGEGASWHINDTDRDLTPRRRSKRCMICRQTDHLMKSCPKLHDKKCTMCGDAHFTKHCPIRICLNCGKKNGDFVSMCGQCVQESGYPCSNCELIGHKSQNCPDIWRKFHSTIGADINQRNESNTKVYCSNCAKPGHFYEDCRYVYGSEYPPTSSFVKNYSEAIQHCNSRHQRFSEPPNFQNRRKRKRQQNQYIELPQKTKNKSKKKKKKNKRFKAGNDQ